MSQADIEAYFQQLPAWMKNDIRREIQLARVSMTEEGRAALERLGVERGGGNLLAALGLVAYTEALGRLRLFNRGQRDDKSEECFLAFFDTMAGGRYGQWRAEWESRRGETIYEALRCGLAHEYQPKVDSAFWIAEGDELGLVEDAGVLIFKVEPYFRHFFAEAEALHAELCALPDPRIPPPQRKERRAVTTAGRTLGPSPGFGTASGPMLPVGKPRTQRSS